MATADYDFLVDWNDDGDYGDTGEDITSRVLRSGGTIKFEYGRDQARSLGATRAGETSFVVNNESRDYMPDNGSSPLAGLLEPGKPLLVQATYSATTYTLFRGFLDDFEITPSINSGVSRVKFSALDMLHKIRQATLSTGVYESLQSGEAINVLLDEIGWPEEDRDIDQGATTLRWWWEEDTDGLTALKKILDSEGPPSFAFVAPDGKFTFRDRHHRFFRDGSTAVQATFNASGTEPLFSDPVTYNIGWKDLINQVVITVDEREAQPINPVWEMKSPFAIAAGESITIDVKTNDPFFEADVPLTTTARKDIVIRSGSVANVELSRYSGQSTKIIITADTATVIDSVRLRAQSLPIVRKTKVTAENAASIEKHGVRTDQNITPVWANVHDALAIGRIIVASRGERLPVIHISVNNGTAERLTQILDRDLSDRIHITETTALGIDDDFFIEQISHEISEAGKVHRVIFGCEKAFQDEGVVPNYFTFGKAGSGFNDGVFGEDGNIQSNLVFILGDPGDNGQLDTAGLGF